MNNISDYIDCTDLLGRPQALREAAAERGYLCFRALLPPNDIQLVRREVLQVAERHEFLAPETKAEEGVARPEVFVSENDPSPEFRLFYNDVQKLRSFPRVRAAPDHSASPGSTLR